MDTTTAAPPPVLTGLSGPGEITRRAARGAVALGMRQLLVHGLNAVGSVFIARLLSPAEFGIYTVFTFFLVFLVVFGDVGLGASLVRQVEEPSREDFQSVFTVQQLLVGTAVGVSWFLAPSLAQAYGGPGQTPWLFRVVALALVFTSLQSIAAIRLERRLDFHKLAVVDVCAALTFNTVAVTLAWQGLGVFSVAVGLLARSMVGALLANLVSPWPFGLRWDWPRVRAFLRFGVPYQGSAAVSLAKDSITPVMVGTLLGAAELGYIQWAGLVAAYPVLAIMVLQRLYMPAFSRMQHHPQELGRFVERVLMSTNALVAPLAVLFLVLIEPITREVFGEKWLVAIPYFYLLWVANVFVATANPLAGLMNALGESGLMFRFALVWMFGTWLAGAPLILALGAAGFAIANMLVQLTNLALFRVAQRRVEFRILRPVLPPWTAAAGMGLLVFLLSRAAPPSGLAGLLALGVAGGSIYFLLLAILLPAGTREIWHRFRQRTWLRESQPS